MKKLLVVTNTASAKETAPYFPDWEVKPIGFVSRGRTYDVIFITRSALEVYVMTKGNIDAGEKYIQEVSRALRENGAFRILW